MPSDQISQNASSQKPRINYLRENYYQFKETFLPQSLSSRFRPIINICTNKLLNTSVANFSGVEYRFKKADSDLDFNDRKVD